MRLRREVWIGVAGLVLGLAGGVALAACGTPVSSSNWAALSISGDTADSCRQLAVHSVTGVVKGKCNTAGATDDQVDEVATEIDLDNAVWCDASETDDSAVLKLESGTNSGTNIWVPHGWSLDLDSTGDDYILTARCRVAGWHVTAEQPVDIGDTTDGLQNSSGSFATR